MQKLISYSPFLYRYILGPVLFIIFPLAFWVGLFFGQEPIRLGNMLLSTRSIGLGNILLIIWMFIIIPIIVLIFGWLFVDQVWDAGNELIVYNFKNRERIPFANIIGLKRQSVIHPTWITLTLRTPCRFGRKIRFLTMPKKWGWRQDSALYDPLIKRIADAHRGFQ